MFKTVKFAMLLAVTGVVIGIAPSALAHDLLSAQGISLAEGFAHPFSGLDHLLALVGLGLWSGRYGMRRTCSVAAAFLSSAAFGFVMGASGLQLPMVELGIAGSVLLIGLLVLLGVTCHLRIAVPLCLLFGLLHGHAHGTELSNSAFPYLYAIGFQASMALLYMIGVATALVLLKYARSIESWVSRALGLITMATGAALLLP